MVHAELLLASYMEAFLGLTLSNNLSPKVSPAICRLDLDSLGHCPNSRCSFHPLPWSQCDQPCKNRHGWVPASDYDAVSARHSCEFCICIGRQIRDIVGYCVTSRVDFCKVGRIGTTVTGDSGNMLNGSGFMLNGSGNGDFLQNFTLSDSSSRNCSRFSHLKLLGLRCESRCFVSFVPQ
jgi:hypothetical protein